MSQNQKRPPNQTQGPKKKKKAKRTQAYSTDSLLLHLVSGGLLIALGIMIILAVIVRLPTDLFAGLRSLCFGLTGSLAVLLPVLPIWGGVLVIWAALSKAPVRPFVLASVLYLLMLASATLLTFTGNPHLALPDYFKTTGNFNDSLNYMISSAFTFGAEKQAGGGLLGMLPAWPLWMPLGAAFAAVVFILLCAVDFLFLVRLNPIKLIRQLAASGEARRAEKEHQEQEQRQQELQWQQEQAIRQQEELARQQAAAAAAAAVPQPVVPQNNRHGFPATEAETHGVNPARRRGLRGLIFGSRQSDPQPSAFQTPGVPLTSQPISGQPGPSPYQRPVYQQEQVPMGQPMPQQPYPPQAPGYQPMPGGPVSAYPPAQASGPIPAYPPVQASGPIPAYPPVQASGPIPAYPPAQASGPIPAYPPAQASGPIPAYPPAQTGGPIPANPPAAAGQPSPFESMHQPTQAPTYQPDTPAPKPAPAKPTPAKGGVSWREQVNQKLNQTQGSQRPEADKPAGPQKPQASWTDDTPPWDDDIPTPAEARMPAPQQTGPRGGWTPELDLAPVKPGDDKLGPMFDEDEPVEIPYVFPELDLLNLPVAPVNQSPEEDAIRAQQLEQTLASFKVEAHVVHITHGPAISRFEMSLGAGIKVSKVTDLAQNIAMNMAVKSVRIEAPIPGKALVGVEVPNPATTPVTLREVLESDPMRAASKSPLAVALGKDIAGTPIICDLARMPHLLIAGATGSGKSVCINTMINSLLYRCSPKEVRMILVDPKVVELQCYNGVPHLLMPVVSDPHKAAGALAWAVGEMMDRYTKFKEKGVRAIDGYNAQLEEGEARMPRIVIIIDELADLMMTCKRDVEDHICRLAQLARAAGIHLVVATQRPSVDVITGLIKANIPSRIAFKVSSFIDSRTILDKQGAEQLLGYGDMLYMPTGEFTPIRIQGCFMKDAEVNRVTDFIRDNSPANYDPDVIEQVERLTDSGDGGPELPDMADAGTGDGNLLAQAIEMAVNDGQVSTSFIQRRLKVGYARAGRLVDEMEKRGIVSQKDGAKPRMCLISREEYERMKDSGELDG